MFHKVYYFINYNQESFIPIAKVFLKFTIKLIRFIQILIFTEMFLKLKIISSLLNETKNFIFNILTTINLKICGQKTIMEFSVILRCEFRLAARVLWQGQGRPYFGNRIYVASENSREALCVRYAFSYVDVGVSLERANPKAILKF